MISIIDVVDFVDLDNETVEAVQSALGLPADETIFIARQLLTSEAGLIVLHHMFRDRIEEAGGNFQPHGKSEWRKAYAHFSRKYPLPHILKDGN